MQREHKNNRSRLIQGNGFEHVESAALGHIDVEDEHIGLMFSHSHDGVAATKRASGQFRSRDRPETESEVTMDDTGIVRDEDAQRG